MFRSSFAGRRGELERLRAAVVAQRCRAVVVTGAVGIGKTRLVRECVAGLDRRRYAVLEVAATATASVVPLGAIAPLLPASMPPGDGHVLISWAATGLVAAAGSRRPVLLVDDAHLLDDRSVTVIYYLARTRRAIVLATVQTGIPLPEAIDTLWKDGYAERVDLDPLGLDDVVEVLRSDLGGPVDRAWASRLWRRTAGDLLHLQELVLAGLHDRSLHQASGVWHQQVMSSPTPRLTELVQRRVGRLTAEEREVLEILAVGEPLGLPTLVSLMGAGPVERLEERRLVRVTVDGRRRMVRLAHPFYGEVISAACPVSRRQRLLGKIADAVQAVGARRREDLVRLAIWRLESGTAWKPHMLLAACQVAYSAWNLPLATRLGYAALKSGGGVPAASLLAIILAFDRRPDEASDVIETLADKPSSDQETTLLTASWAFVQFWSKDRVASTTAKVAAVVAELQDPVARDQLSAFLQLLRAHQGEYNDVITETTMLLTDEAVSPEAKAISLAAQTYANAPLGWPHQSLSAYDAACAKHAGILLEFPHVRRALDVTRCIALTLSGQVTEANQVAEAELQRASEMPNSDDLREALFTAVRALCARLQGRICDARKLADEAHGLFQMTLGCPAMAAGELAHAYALAGNATLAQTAMKQADMDRRDSLQPLQHWLELARAWVVLSTSGRIAAVDTATRTAQYFQRRGLAGYEVHAWYDLVRLGQPGAAADRLIGLASKVEGDIAASYAAHAVAVLRNDAMALESVTDHFVQLGLNLYAAEVQVAAAKAYRQRGDRLASACAEARAKKLAKECQGARTPALAEITTPDLSPREREVALLAATGITSREIAERLHCSVRTVENHLRSIYNKLRIVGRDELKKIF